MNFKEKLISAGMEPRIAKVYAEDMLALWPKIQFFKLAIKRCGFNNNTLIIGLTQKIYNEILYFGNKLLFVGENKAIVNFHKRFFFDAVSCLLLTRGYGVFTVDNNVQMLSHDGLLSISG